MWKVHLSSHFSLHLVITTFLSFKTPHSRFVCSLWDAIETCRECGTLLDRTLLISVVEDRLRYRSLARSWIKATNLLPTFHFGAPLQPQRRAHFRSLASAGDDSLATRSSSRFRLADPSRPRLSTRRIPRWRWRSTLLLLLLLCQLARADDLRLRDRCLVRRGASWDEHSNAALILAILGVFAGGDQLRQPG
jgi:hypothetical protein